jgi:hypothetical protein
MEYCIWRHDNERTRDLFLNGEPVVCRGSEYLGNDFLIEGLMELGYWESMVAQQPELGREDVAADRAAPGPGPPEIVSLRRTCCPGPDATAHPQTRTSARPDLSRCWIRTMLDCRGKWWYSRYRHTLEAYEMRTTVDVPGSLLRDAQEAAGVSTRKEALIIALSEFVRRRRLRRVAEAAGKLEFDIEVRDVRRLDRRRRT